MKVQHVLGHEKICKNIRNVVEFGCAELKLFVYIKNGLKNVTKVEMVDIDGELLERFKSKINPLISEHLKKRESPLTVNLWQGNIADPNENFRNADAVICIEL